MANNFDQFPLEDPLVKAGSLSMSESWIGSMSNFFQNLIGYLTQFGILLPRVTTVQRDEIQAPQGGQMIYNTTLGSAQYFKVDPVTLIGTWTSF